MTFTELYTATMKGGERLMRERVNILDGQSYN